MNQVLEPLGDAQIYATGIMQSKQLTELAGIQNMVDTIAFSLNMLPSKQHKIEFLEMIIKCQVNLTNNQTLADSLMTFDIMHLAKEGKLPDAMPVMSPQYMVVAEETLGVLNHHEFDFEKQNQNLADTKELLEKLLEKVKEEQ